MLLATAIAVLPVLLTTIWESRYQRAGVPVATTYGTARGYNRAPLSWSIGSVPAKSHADCPDGHIEEVVAYEAVPVELLSDDEAAVFSRSSH